jgi:hypothetical protein
MSISPEQCKKSGKVKRRVGKRLVGYKHSKRRREMEGIQAIETVVAIDDGARYILYYFGTRGAPAKYFTSRKLGGELTLTNSCILSYTSLK